MKKVSYIFIMVISFMLLDNGVFALDGTYNVSSATEYFNAIAEIHNNSNKEYIINLQDDITISDSSLVQNSNTIDNGNTVTFIGNGHKFKFSISTGRLRVTGATVNLGKADKSDTLFFEGGGEGTATSESLVSVDNGTLNMYDGVKLSDNHSGSMGLTGGALRIQTNAIVNMYGGEISNNSVTSSGYGGAIGMDYDGAVFNMFGGEIKDNIATGYGAGIFLMGNSTINIKGGKFTNNDSQPGHGGAIAALSGSVNIENATFDSNKGRYGGALLISELEVSIKNATFKDNEGSNGGAIINYGGTTTIEGSIFTGNTASYGGAIRNYQGTLTSKNNTYKNNDATSGGALYNDATLVSDKDEITENTALNAGGVYLRKGTANLLTTDVYNNKAVDRNNQQSFGNDYIILSAVTELSIKDASTMDKTVDYGDNTTNITNWYNDDEPRFTLDNPTDVIEYSTITAGNQYLLTAAGSKGFKALLKETNGNLLNTSFVLLGNKLLRPTDPVKTGYKFLGWYTDEAGTTEYNFDNVLESNITIYAKFEKIEQEVKPATEDDTNVEPNPDTGDNIITYLVLSIISIVGLTSIAIYKKREN